MLHKPLLISPAAAFWSEVVRILLTHPQFTPAVVGQSRDFSSLRVVVPTFVHAQLLKTALLQDAGTAFVPPRITTLASWCAMLEPETERPLGDGARLMDLYAELRQHAWLKKLFSARRNADLLPLAQML
ncbi:MAG TPA: PD-(D/E)XK nuclease family protein, partial [Burkholderiaceae bacterium]|nr:PD-(D/E)XK nuclease family protein [Burkholderiaceae bacterium]